MSKSPLRIGIYSPYMDTAGGGEKYMLSIAEILSEKEKVEVFLDANLFSLGERLIKEKVSKLHGINFSKIKFIQAPFGKGSNPIARFIFLKKYDWLFYLTDGSLFYSSAKNSVLHFQVPFEQSSVDSLAGKIKLQSWNLVIFNSNFTKEIVEKNWQIKGRVIYPPVDVAKIKLLKKKKQILSVGRFFGFLKAKKQELMINVFRELVNEGNLAGWSFHLAGGAGEGDFEYLSELEKLASGFDIHIYPNIPLEKLHKLYGESSIYWHAMGFGEVDPKKHEHFGITTVEAMAAGCVPVVINLGGQKEIVTSSENGFLWDSIAELKLKTIKLIENEKLREELSIKAVENSKKFSKDKFKKEILNLVYGNNS